MKIKRFASLLVVVLLATVASVAQQAELDPSAAKLQQHVSYLASDALDGRRTGTNGANDAARYIAGEFSRLGLRPGNDATVARRRREVMAQYLQTFPYVARVDLGQDNELVFIQSGIAKGPLLVTDEWMPLGFSANGKASGQLWFAGYGITAAEQNYDDYAGLDVKDGVAVVLQGTPDGDNPHGQFARYEGIRWKAIAARNAGAKALIVVARENDFQMEKLARLTYDNSGDAGLPVMVIARSGVDRLFGTQTLPSWKEIAKEKSQSKKQTIDGQFRINIDVIRKEVPAYNVVGILEGSDPVLKKEYIVIGAHYDHLGRGGEGSLAPRSGEIHHGADANASGTAGVIELARIFSAQKPKLKRTLIFMAFGGEEEGLLGSNYYVNHPLVPLANTVAMINMDMIGRMKDRKLIIGGVGTAKEWRGMIEPEKSFELTLNEDGFGPSDHSSFYGKQVPVLFFWTGTHNDYHKPSDTWDKINYNDEAKILSFVARLVRDIDGADKRLSYTWRKSDPAPRSAGFRVYLGTIPNYAETSDGVLIDGVRENSPAAKGGLKGGDRIVKIGDRDVKNVYDYTYALGEMKAGQEYVFEVVRGSEKLTLRITPEARK